MISGFNTDIEFGNTVYHVQTEDKGLKSRLIVSLVYDGGTILASKRLKYDELLTEEFDEKLITEGVQRQHKLICAAVKAGRVGELKEMTAKSRTRAELDTSKEPTVEIADAPQVSIVVAADLKNIVMTKPAVARAGESYANIPAPADPIPVAESKFVTPPNICVDKPLIDAVSIIEDDEILPAEAVEVVSQLSGVERPSNTKLGIELLGGSKFRGGDRRTVKFIICRGTERKVIADAEIMVKILGSSFRPVIFHAKSDANGLANIHIQLPHFEAGRAALLVRAIAGGEEIELRRIVTPG